VAGWAFRGLLQEGLDALVTGCWEFLRTSLSIILALNTWQI
jgi:hypothetical protein